MKVSNSISQRVISLVVAIALLGAPGLPAPASAPMDAAAHAAHGGASVANAEATALHANHGKAGEMAGADSQPAAGCAQHDQCNGKCCAACAQCFTAAFNFFITSLETYSVQFPTVLHLDDRLTVAAHNRPPTA
ncbi:MAG: hypothetical protein HY082_01780 [Gammaproteobacteria bacterium]|nr:hypothetical protein [Gammaproteobacteria bacterium]